MKDLILHVKKKYFEQIQSGEKLWEYRLANAYWIKRFCNNSFSGVQIHSGYPRSDDRNRILRRPWQGYVTQQITHEHFGPDPVWVFAINVREGGK